MEKICIVDLKRCPVCKQNLLLENEYCQYCGIEIRRINKNKIKNKNHLRKICKYDLDGKIENIYKNVYECYPEDSKKGTQKRKRVIEVCDKKSKQFDGYQWKYPSRQSRVDHRIKFMMPIDEFINEFVKTKEIAGACIYILTDENGRRYIGQSNRDDYARIAEHFDGSSKDRVYEAYLKNVKFYVEHVITGWKEINIFNLNDAETYFIAKYNSFDDGYNATRGNHQCNIGKIDQIK